MANREYTKLIEQYFSGNMSPEDRLLFEGRVASDPMLKSEFENQSDIVEGLRNHRALELKTRLDAIDVTPGVWASLTQTTAFKPIAYSVSSLIIASASYLAFSPSESFEYQLDSFDPIKVTLESQVSMISAEVDYYHEGADKIYDFYQEQEFEKIENTQLSNPDKTSLATAKEISFEVPDVAVDNDYEEVHNSDVQIENVKGIESVSSISRADKISIETIASRRYNFHYKIEDNRLFLYGKFSETPYEIIEVNRAQDRQLFFYYYGDFYNLNQKVSKISPLKKIKDRKLIHELDRLKSGNQ